VVAPIVANPSGLPRSSSIGKNDRGEAFTAHDVKLGSTIAR
jgi:hypothetical protein